MNQSYSKIRSMQYLNLIAESRHLDSKKNSLINEKYSGKEAEGFFGKVVDCKKELPYNVVAKAGLNWGEVKEAWGSSGSAQDNSALRDAFCAGWRPGDVKDGGSTVTTGTEEKPGEQQGTVPSTEQKPKEQGTTPGTGNQPVDDKKY